MELNDDKEFFRYLVSKVVQTTPNNETPEAYADQVFNRAIKVFQRVKDYEATRSTGTYKDGLA